MDLCWPDFLSDGFLGRSFGSSPGFRAGDGGFGECFAGGDVFVCDVVLFFIDFPEVVFGGEVQ